MKHLLRFARPTAAVLLACAMAFAVGSYARAQSYPKLESSYKRCHCPCKVGDCDCTMHPADCHRCKGLVINTDEVFNVETPVVVIEDAPWFKATPSDEIHVKLLAVMSDTEEVEPFPLTLVLASDPSAEPATYVADGSFDPDALRRWKQRADRSKAAGFSAGAMDDPATFRILDGQPTHLTENMDLRVYYEDGVGRRHLIFRDDATLEWQMVTYLRSATAGIEEEAFVGSSDRVRSDLFSMIDTMDLMVKAGNFEAASDVIRRAQDLLRKSLHPDHRDTQNTICAFGKMLPLLLPGSDPSCPIE